MAFAWLFSLPNDVICNVPQQSVYFAEDSIEHIKIGVSRNLKKRLGGLQTGSSIQHRLIGSIPGGKHLETKLHSDFALLRMKGEWFHATQGLRSFVEIELGIREPRVAPGDLVLDSYGNSVFRLAMYPRRRGGPQLHDFPKSLLAFAGGRAQNWGDGKHSTKDCLWRHLCSPAQR
jgi:hypothetical protein